MNNQFDTDVQISLIERVGILIGSAVYRTLVGFVGASIVAGIWLVTFAVMDRHADYNSPDWVFETAGEIWLVMFCAVWIAPSLATLLMGWISGDTNKV